MKISIVAVAALAATAASAQTSHAVRGYTRSDGTYVEPHRQSDPDSSRTNNYSSQGNTNPYTGQTGTVDPYAPKPLSNPYETKPYNPYAPK